MKYSVYIMSLEMKYLEEDGRETGLRESKPYYIVADKNSKKEIEAYVLAMFRKREPKLVDDTKEISVDLMISR